MLQLFRTRATRTTPVSAIEIAFSGQRYRIALKRVGKARRFTLRVRAATLDAVLTIPKGGSLKAARSFAERHAEWVATRLDKLPKRIALVAGAKVPLRGQDVAIVGRPPLRAAAWLDQREAEGGGRETVIYVSGDPDEQRRRVLDLLRREARRDLEAAVSRHAAAVGKASSGIFLRDTKSRWGSCTARGTLNFSWRLIMAPPYVLDYLAAHEVAHLVHMNHSAAYWALAERLAPELHVAEAWLKQQGATLHRYG